MTRGRARGVMAALLLIGWVTAVSASCDSEGGRSATRSSQPAASGGSDRIASDEGKGGTQLDFSQPAPRASSPARQLASAALQPAPTVLQPAPTAQPVQAADPRIGALFEPDANGPHFCTASVVPSPGHDLVMTAAHCINGGNGQGNSAIVFIPGYRDGIGPYGVWTVRALVVDPRWANGADPDYDVGFVVLNRNDGQNIQDVAGANPIDFNAGYSHLVRVTGYPEKDDAPVSCENWTTRFSATQLRFACAGFYAGTSGSPWITVGHEAATPPGEVVGVIGGYQRGGDTNFVSYGVYLGGAIAALYKQAEATSAS
jgi:V8-like Glu-specific endopeptidase